MMIGTGLTRMQVIEGGYFSFSRRERKSLLLITHSLASQQDVTS